MHHEQPARRALMLVTALLGVLLCAPAAQAATFTVNTTTDAAGACPTPTTCTLRQALSDADAAAGDDTINFNLAAGSVIGLTLGTLTILPPLVDAVTVAGPGADALTVRPDPSVPPFPVLQVFGGASVAITGLTIAGGVAGPFDGPAIGSVSPLLLDRMVITGNSSDAGGGGSSGALVLTGPATIRNSTLHGNSVSNSGGGQSSGAIVNLAQLLVVNSTIAANQVTGPGPGDGGAIANLGGATTLINSTVTGNVVVGGAGGVFGPRLVLANTILAGNTGSAGPDCAATPVSQGYNILGDPTGCAFTAATGDQVGTGATPLNPLLGPLASNGGTTPTRTLLAGSPARDAGNPAAVSDVPTTGALAPCATTDQRGIARPSGTRCDIGAIEVVVPPPLPPPPPPPPPPPVVPPPVPPPPFVAPPVDHFKCYAANDARFERRSVRLRDQFASNARTASLRKATLLCNPARKNASRLLEPKAHLVCYQSRDVASFRARTVSVTNQFGTRTLRVVKPVSLCVPSLKRKGGRAPGTTPDPQRRLDHFRCYAVDPKLTPRNVTTADQFLTTRTTVVSVVRLCNPVSKNGGAVRRPVAHLVCYSIRDRVTAPVRAATVRNQFGVARLSVGRARSLCVPSLKRDLAAASVPRAWRALR